MSDMFVLSLLICNQRLGIELLDYLLFVDALCIDLSTVRGISTPAIWFMGYKMLFTWETQKVNNIHSVQCHSHCYVVGMTFLTHISEYKSCYTPYGKYLCRLQSRS